MAHILLSGSLAYDRIMVYPGYFKDNFLPDKLHAINVSFYIPRQVEHYGGTAGNIAYNLALLGERPEPIASVGKDFLKYKAYLDEKGVNTALIQIQSDLPTACAYIITDQADNQISAYYPGASSAPYLHKSIPNELETMGVVSAGCLDDIRTLPGLFRERGTPFLFDPGQSLSALTGEDIMNGIDGAEAVFANDYEFQLICSKTGCSETDIVQKANVLVVTLGGEGSRVVTREGELRVPVVPAETVKDPTGAGDAYRAGYIKGLLSGKEPSDCARLGSAVAVYAVEAEGTQEHTFTLEDVSRRYVTTYGTDPGIIANTK